MKHPVSQHSHAQDSFTHQHLELIRLAERDGHFDNTKLRAVEHAVCRALGAPFEKLVRRAQYLDSEGNYRSALTESERSIRWAALTWSFVCFVMGLFGAMGLLSSHLLNFFYLLVALLGWHSISLLWWLMRTKRSPEALENILYKLQKLFNNNNKIHRLAMHIHLNAMQPVRHWQLATYLHHAWLMGLLGNIVALLLLFLLRRYDFVWESTLLSQAHIAKLMAAVAYLPMQLGFDMPSASALAMGNADPSRIAWLLIVCLLLYGLLPRLCAFFYSQWRFKRHVFHIDSTLYYYEHLLRLFRERITDMDDYRPSDSPKPIQAIVSQGKKIAATLELPADLLWYQFGAGFDTLDAGVLDSADDFQRLAAEVSLHEAQVYLGISVTLLPDRGVLKRLQTVQDLARFGMVVELLDDVPANTTPEHSALDKHSYKPNDKPNHKPNYRTQWQKQLSERNIAQVRYH